MATGVFGFRKTTCRCGQQVIENAHSICKTCPNEYSSFSVSNSAFEGMGIYVFCPTVNHMVNGNTFPSFAYFSWTRVSDTEISITYGYKGGWGNASAPNLPFILQLEFTDGRLSNKQHNLPNANRW